jgi:hypothetical protein
MRASKRGSARGNYPHAAGTPEKTLKEDVRSLLNEVEAQSAYFERVNAAKKRIQQKFNIPDFPALSEILQIRRDFWAASEIFLMEGIRELRPELGDAQSCETFQAEARALLFKEGAALPANARDSVELRLAIAREGAVAFQAEAARAVAAELEKSRPPSAAKIIAVLWSLVKAVSAGLREASHLLGDAAATARSLASATTLIGRAPPRRPLPNVVLPPQDRKLLEDLIRDGNEKGIDQYVRLSSLSGTTGAATKLGLTGLPLATASLTIFFSALAIFGINGFLDLTKLTLGAFIGSFVQRTTRR